MSSDQARSGDAVHPQPGVRWTQARRPAPRGDPGRADARTVTVSAEQTAGRVVAELAEELDRLAAEIEQAVHQPATLRRRS